MLDRIKCKLSFHNWDMYAGYDYRRVHQRAKCRRCGKKYKEVK